MRAALAQINPVVGDLRGNTEKICRSIRSAKERGASLILFSELALSGYPPEDLLLFDSFIEAFNSCLERIAAETEG